MANSADKLVIFFLFFPENRFDISCKLSPLETICMKFQNLFSGKNKKKNISVCCLLKILPRVLSVRYSFDKSLRGIGTLYLLLIVIFNQKV